VSIDRRGLRRSATAQGAAALCGSHRCPSETEQRHVGRPRSPACGLPLMRWPSPSETRGSLRSSLHSPSSALLASGAPPSPFGPAAGFSSSSWLPGREFQEILSWGSVPLQSSSRRCRPCSLTATSAEAGRIVRVARDPPLLGLLLPRTQLRRVPLTPHRQLSRRCGGRGLAEPSPVPSSGFLPLSTVLAANADRIAPLAEHAVFRDAPKLRGLVPCRSRPWRCPTELSPLEEPYPLSRAVASVWVRVRPPPARRSASFSGAFPLAPTLCRGGPEGSPDAWAGTQGSPHRREGSVVRAEARRPQPLPARRPSGSPVNGRHAHFEALLPSGVRSRGDPKPWPGWGRRVGALLGFLPL